MLNSFIIRPVLGIRSNVPQNSPVLFREGNLCHCVDGVNFDLSRRKWASTKSYGYTQWSNSANAQATRCVGLFELIDSSDNVNHIFFDNGRMYYYDTSRDPVAVDHATPVVMADEDLKLYSMIQYGDHIVWTDWGEHEPYCWTHGGANFEEAKASGTAYKFRYLETYQNYIFGAYSDQTNGDIEIRWSNNLPIPGAAAGDLTFAAGNQLYKPGNDSITGIKKFGSNACFLYGETSIDSIDYYGNYLTPFAIRNMVAGQGAVNHHSVVDAGGRHFFLNKNYGFCEYRGGTEFPYGGRPISEAIEDKIASITPGSYLSVVGEFLPQRNEIVWTVPLNGATSPNALLFYNVNDGNWRVEDKVARYVDNWTVVSSLIWDGATYDLADAGITYWSDFGSSALSQYVSSSPRMAFANTDGQAYFRSTEANNEGDIDGYRIEPILDFNQPENKDLLLEIWFDIVDHGEFSIYLEHRSGDTIAECENASFTAVDSISCDDPANAVCYLSKLGRFHQIKWGTDAKDEKFGVNAIEFKYASRGRY